MPASSQNVVSSKPQQRVPDSSNYERQRARMVAKHLRGRGLRDERVLAAMAAVPRHLFVPPGFRSAAYDDTPLPLGRGYHQFIAEPWQVASVLEGVSPKRHERVLEVGTGSGYQAALLSHLAQQVYTIDMHEQLATRAAKVLSRLQVENVTVLHGDGTCGYEAEAPYDVIVVAGAIPSIPTALVEQLGVGGRLIAPVGSTHTQELQRVTKLSTGLQQTSLGSSSFGPLLGSAGY